MAAAQLRVERAKQQLDEFQRERAHDLLEEWAAEARDLARKLARSGHELVQLHRAYLVMRTEVDSLVGATPNAVPSSHGPPGLIPWERHLPPLPRWAGLSDASRRKRLTEEEQQDLDRNNHEHGGTPAVTTLRSEEWHTSFARLGMGPS